MIDAGFNLREITKRIPIDPKTLSAILLTHEHSDHLCGVGDFAREFSIPVYLPKSLYQVVAPKLDGVEIITFSDGEMTIDGVTINSFRLPHDAVYTVGYKMEYGSESFAYLTDCGDFTNAVFNNIKGAQTIFIESNYDLDMLRGGKYPPIIKARIESRLGHMSNDDCAKAVVDLAKKGTKKFILGHISENNNAPELAYDTVTKSLRDNGYDLPVFVASQRKVKLF